MIITEHVAVNPKVLNGDKSLGGYIRLQNAKASSVFLDKAPFSLECETIYLIQRMMRVLMEKLFLLQGGLVC
ncbi:MAG TPA: hypothetical protein VFM79_12565 [Pelobium sp.]|nr:hypothetical protein [Pelobium sp.]